MRIPSKTQSNTREGLTISTKVEVTSGYTFSYNCNPNNKANTTKASPSTTFTVM